MKLGEQLLQALLFGSPHFVMIRRGILSCRFGLEQWCALPCKYRSTYSAGTFLDKRIFCGFGRNGLGVAVEQSEANLPSVNIIVHILRGLF